jgi:hypothetical protein
MPAIKEHCRSAVMKGDWSAATTRTVDLGYDQLLVLEAARPGTRVRVLYGNMWLTEEGTAQDVFAGSGAEVQLKSRGRAVVEGLGAARVQVIEPRSASPLTRLARLADISAFTRRVRAAGQAAARLLHA